MVWNKGKGNPGKKKIRVRTIEAGPKKTGSYTKQDRAIFWDGKNDTGQKVANGLYYINLKADKFSATKAMVVK
ncbi:MAG: FlgD immunoglobulin-like domain containing protein [bacterium]|nr:FlgD immunoglobulin-like domain containing protein [bacterium]